MIRFQWPLLAIMFVTACGGTSAPRSTTLTGEETARAAAERTRKVQASGDSGVIYASSIDAPEAKSDAPTEIDKLPVATPPPTIDLKIANDGSLTFQDSAITVDEAKAKFAEISKAHPGATLNLKSSYGTPPDSVAELVDAAKAAGIQRIVVEIPTPSTDAGKPDTTSAPITEPSE